MWKLVEKIQILLYPHGSMKPFSFEQFFDLSAFEHQMLFEQTSSVWETLFKLKAYLKTHAKGEIQGIVDSRSILVHDASIVIGEGSVVEPTAYIEGPCIIGRGCQIRHGAYIRGNVVIGDNCVIGHATEIKHSILLDGAKAGHFAYIGDSILGNGVNLGAGVKLANLRLDQKKVSVLFEGEPIPTGLKKLGAILGDRAQIGCNAVTNPGTVLPKRTLVPPCVSIGGFYASRRSQAQV